ncbi:MAG: Hsp20/alpha crystallin family protein [Pseudomonadota bacterium]
MSDPFDLGQQLSSQLGSLSRALGPEFWQKVGEVAGVGSMAGGLPGAKAGQPQRPDGRGEQPAPPLELYVTTEEVVISAILPGLTAPEQVGFALTGPAELLIEAYLPPHTPHGLTLQRERYAGFCHRLITLPVSVFAEGARASYTDGILELRLRRAEPGAGSAGVAVLQVQSRP